MSEMIEAVARAIFASLKDDVHNTEWDFGQGPVNVSEESKERYRRMARAAIEAMREPTEEMVEAGDGCDIVYDALKGTENNSADCETHWQAMVSAALSPASG